jgi:hypothetical protein
VPAGSACGPATNSATAPPAQTNGRPSRSSSGSCGAATSVDHVDQRCPPPLSTRPNFSSGRSGAPVPVTGPVRRRVAGKGTRVVVMAGWRSGRGRPTTGPAARWSRSCRLRRPSSRRQRHDGHRGTGLTLHTRQIGTADRRLCRYRKNHLLRMIPHACHEASIAAWRRLRPQRRDRDEVQAGQPGLPTTTVHPSWVMPATPARSSPATNREGRGSWQQPSAGEP